MRRLFAGLMLSLLLCVFSPTAHAVNYVVVASCGSLPSTPSLGSGNGPIAIDQNGNVCGSASAAAGSATSANQASQITQETATNTNLGAPGATACATDTGSCSLNALLQRLAQRITSAISGTAVTGTFWQTTQPVSLAAVPLPPGYLFSNIIMSTTTTVKSGAGVLHTVCVNTDGTVASAVQMYDNTAASGTKIGNINSLSSTGCYTYDIAFSTGLTVVTTGSVASDITVTYR